MNKLKKKLEVEALQFEEMIDRLEKGSGQQVIKKIHRLQCEPWDKKPLGFQSVTLETLN